MKFIIGENAFSYLERIAYRGCVGLFYSSTIGGVLTFIIAILFFALAIIGLITVLRFFIKGRKPKETPGQKWLRTGRID